MPKLNKQYIILSIYKIVSKFVVKKSKKSVCFKWTYELFGNDYRVATLPKSYLIVIGIIKQSLISKGQF